MKPRIRFGFLLVLVCVAVVGPVGAEPPPPPPPFDLPLIRSDSITGFGTIAYRFTVPEGADIAFSWEASFAGGTTVGDGIWLYDSDSDFAFLFGGWGIATASGPIEYHVEAPEPIGVVIDRRNPGSEGFGSGFLVFASGLPAGEYVVFMGAVSDGTFSSGSAELHGSEGTALVSVGGGLGGFMHREADFRGTNVLVGAGYRAKAIVRAAVEETNDRPALFGSFASFGDAELSLLKMKGPDGPKRLAVGYYFASEPSGPYQFLVDADLGIGDLFAWGVEGAYPPPGLPVTGE